MLMSARHSNGFTLVELMVTVSVMAILSAIALPSFQTLMAENRASAKTIELAAAIKTAQSEALRRNRQVVFTLTKSPNPTVSLESISGTPNTTGLNWATAALKLAGSDASVSAYEVIGIGGFSDGTADVVIKASTAAVCILPDGSLKANTATGITNATCTTANATFLVKPARGDKRWQVRVSPMGNISNCVGLEDSGGLFSCS